MPSMKGITSRVRGDDVKRLADELAALRALVYEMNHRITQVADVVEALNHDVRSGADEALPLFHGYLERVRNDAETSLSATQVIERQLVMLDDRLRQLDTRADG